MPGEVNETLLNPMGEEWVAAVHEAGHAVIGDSRGYELRDVFIKDAYCCRVTLERPPGEPAKGISSPTLEEDERNAMYTLAGEKAELHLNGSEEGGFLSTSDREIFDSLGPPKRNCAEREEWRARMEFATEALVAEHWPEILAVARELAVHKSLSGRHVKGLIEEALARPSSLK